ncbi:uncharacterized protein LOC120211164 [Hibiscus syriacus]|uniref:uncharacterized protein LOC120211164 n=1 Tax=Hibiscus syriacus TaxID=106335 RepID=UPI001924A2D9|nr:uncharacterized protein LOC120211164 [Hibiscus syriacus]
MRRDHVGGQLPFTSIGEGTSTNADTGVSTSSYSDSSESEPMFKQWLSSHRNVSSRYCFLSKPIHPLSFPMETLPQKPWTLQLQGFQMKQSHHKEIPKAGAVLAAAMILQIFSSHLYL